MGVPYQNTISSLLQKRDELMRDAKDLREQLAVVGNNVEALDRTLETLGFKGRHENRHAGKPRSAVSARRVTPRLP